MITIAATTPPPPEGNEMKRFFKQLFCRHKKGRVLSIEWDGTTVCECSNCQKTVYLRLDGKRSYWR